MPSLKPLYLFVLKLSVVYGLFLIPWPGVTTAYRAAFSTGGNTFFRTLGGSGRAYFRSKEGPITDDKDVIARLENVGNRAAGNMEMNSRLMGYLPTCFAVSLVLATPVSLNRKTIALLWALALTSCFVGVTVWLRLVNALSNSDVLAVYAFGPFWKGAVVVLLKVLAMSPVTAYIAPVVIWVLVTLRREDLVRVASHVRGGSGVPARVAES